MQSRLRLFLEWGISFGDPYLLPERAARTVAYASKQELEQAISLRNQVQQTEDDTPPIPPTGDRTSYAKSKRNRREPSERGDMRTKEE